MDRVGKALGVALVALGITAAIYAIWPPVGSAWQAWQDWVQPSSWFDSGAAPDTKQAAWSMQRPAFRRVAPPEEPVVVIVNQSRTPQLPPQEAGVVPPRDLGSSARQLQRELRRVGCYEGAINGEWTLATRAAAQAFIDRVNARLPLSRPDPILLTLVQGYKDKVCGVPCPGGQVLRQDHCIPTAVLAQPKGHAGDGSQTTPAAIASRTTSVPSPDANATTADATAGRGNIPAPAMRTPRTPRVTSRNSSRAAGGGSWAAWLLQKSWGPF
jgi:hypothetical protein